jgi:hypothetical protein
MNNETTITTKTTRRTVVTVTAVTKPAPTRLTDARGLPVVHVPLAKDHGAAVLDEADFDYLTKELGLTVSWCLNGNARGVYVRAGTRSVQGKLLTVARLIVGAGARQQVRYRDKDTTNLRRSNLILEAGNVAVRNDVAALIEGQEAQRREQANKTKSPRDASSEPLRIEEPVAVARAV